MNKYNFVVGLWRRVSCCIISLYHYLALKTGACADQILFQIATVTGELRYIDALKLLYTLDDASRG